jgi:hypothetical protein
MLDILSPSIHFSFSQYWFPITFQFCIFFLLNGREADVACEEDLSCSDCMFGFRSEFKKGKRDKVKSSEKRPGSSGLSGESNPSNTDTFIE